jgi:Domain of unknown function (DUF4157)
MAELQRTAVPRRSTGPIVRTSVPGRVAERGTHESSPSAGTLQRMLRSGALQARLVVGPPDDAFERDAERTADLVTGTGEGATRVARGPLAAGIMRLVQRATGKGEKDEKRKDETVRVQKHGEIGSPTPEVGAGVEASIGRMSSSGTPLTGSTLNFFEDRFGYDFSSVRLHASPEAAGAAMALNARAFTVGHHIFFGAGQLQPDTGFGRHLLAHELTHTIQQQPDQAKLRPIAVQRTPWVQRDGVVDTILEKLRGWAMELPPYGILAFILGKDPITDKPVERSAVNFVQAVLKLVPNGDAIFKDLQESKAIEKTVQWFETEVTKLNLTWSGIKKLFKDAWDAIGVLDLLSPSTVWGKIKAIFGPTLGRIANFALAVGAKLVELIREKVLGKLAEWAKGIPGYLLLTFVMGRDPFTGAPVERTAKNFVHAVLDLVPGGDKIFENLEKSKTIERTVEWLNGEITKLDLSWDKIKALFTALWDSFTVTDLLSPLGIIKKVADIFGPPVKRVIAFALAVGKKVLEFIFEGVMHLAGPIGTQVVRIVQKIGDTFMKIVNDPVGFVKNLVEAVKQGLAQFAKNILEHLKTGVFEWLFGALEGAGLQLPAKWDLQGILSIVLQVLGLTYARMRVKLVKLLGSEERVAMLERAFDFLKALVTKGPIAAWEKIVEAIGSFTDLVIGGIREWAISKIVTAAITKLVTMFNPAGAIIQAIIATYNTIAFFVERIKQILALVEAVVDSIASIVAGKLAAAANYVEKSMAKTIPVILGFLARLIGLGDVSGAIKKVITGIQAKVDVAIDKVLAWVVEKGKALLGKGGAKPGDKAADPKTPAAAAGVDPPSTTFPEEGKTHTISVAQVGAHLVAMVASDPTPVLQFIEAAKGNSAFKSPTKQTHLAKADTAAAAVVKKTAAFETASDADKATKRTELVAAEVALADALRLLLSGVDLKAFDQKYKLEGLVATYGSMPRQTNDKLTPDHQPQASLLKHAAELKYGGKLIFAGTRLRKAVEGHATGAVAINLHHERHILGLTYGKSPPSSVIADLDTVAKDTKAPADPTKPMVEKQTRILELMNKQKEKDCNKIIAIAAASTSYPDLILEAGSVAKAQTQIDAVKAQIIAGETTILGRNLMDYQLSA